MKKSLLCALFVSMYASSSMAQVIIDDPVHGWVGSFVSSTFTSVDGATSWTTHDATPQAPLMLIRDDSGYLLSKGILEFPLSAVELPESMTQNNFTAQLKGVGDSDWNASAMRFWIFDMADEFEDGQITAADIGANRLQALHDYPLVPGPVDEIDVTEALRHDLFGEGTAEEFTGFVFFPTDGKGRGSYTAEGAYIEMNMVAPDTDETPASHPGFSEDFENGNCDEWFVSFADLSYEVAAGSGADGSNYALRIDDDRFGYSISKVFPGITPVSVSWWVKSGGTTYAGGKVIILGNAAFPPGSWTDKGAEQAILASVELSETGSIRVAGEGDMVSHEADTWYFIELLNIDYGNHTFDLHVNDSLISSGVSFFTACDTIGRIDLSGSSGTTTAYFDNITVGPTGDPVIDTETDTGKDTGDDTDTQPITDGDTETSSDTDKDTGTGSGTDSDFDSNANADSNGDTDSDFDTEIDTDTGRDNDAGSDSDSKASSDTSGNADTSNVGDDDTANGDVDETPDDDGKSGKKRSCGCNLPGASSASSIISILF